jgi:hypothetical protein
MLGDDHCRPLTLSRAQGATFAARNFSGCEQSHVLSKEERVVAFREDIVLANALKTRLIADARIKTDKVDAAALATLLSGNLVAWAHIPDRQTRQRKQELRQRLCWARLRTRVRNWIHALLARQHHLELPQCADLFGRRGLGFLRGLQLKSSIDRSKVAPVSSATF